MTIQEMHQTFRVFAQQMGMQLVRAILPEEIDVYLNAAINEKVREVISSNVTTAFNDRIGVQDNPISPINYIRTLYKQKYIYGTDPVSNIFNLTDNTDIMLYTSISVIYEDDKIYACRLIEPDKVNETLRDFCNGASFDYPIATLYNHPQSGEVIEIFNDKKAIKEIVIRYIANPAKVKYDSTNAVDCDLPEYTHNDIVQLACQKYFVSVGSTTHNVNQ